ncbi:MAG: response regulator, partial [Chloroflexi bacterium]|nr:response regulator [Chloroflexota bacterium]
GVVTDISDRKQMEAQFLQAQKMETVGRLAGGVAHDFNNLLTAISGYSTLALDNLGPTDPLREDIEQVIKASNRAAALTRQLLAFSRRQIIQPRIVNLNDLMLELDKMLRRLIGEDIEMVTLPAPGLGSVRVDPTQIEQILVNLAVNARDAMTEGGKLTIETDNVALDREYALHHVGVVPGEYVMLAVSDTGCGIPEDVRARIFEPFFTAKDVGKGSGLGLPIVYGIVKQHGGHIFVYSEEGHGTSFKIYLPQVAGQPTPTANQPPVSKLPTGTETVLLVEDEPLVRAMAKRILLGQGYTVLEASNGDEAIWLAQEHLGEIHLLLTDVVMPGMSGKELSWRLQTLRPTLRILYISGYASNAIVHGGVLDQGTEFLQKPFTISTLAHKVREVLES